MVSVFNDEGQRDEVWGCQDPSHTGLNIIHPTSQVSIIDSDEEVVRLKAKTDGSTCLVYTGFRGELEHLKVETRLIGESFECAMGECVI